MVKSYLRYVQDQPFGVIATPNANVLLHANGVWAITPAQEYIHVYQLQQGTLLHSITHTPAGNASSTAPPPSVRALCSHPTEPNTIAAGYDDGSIRLFSLTSLACTLTLHGHTSAVTCLSFSRSGALLVSGSADTSIIAWDVVSHKGIVRLKGHRDAVTCLALVERTGRVRSATQSSSVSGLMCVSGSKDGSMRVWDVEGQHCCQSVVSDKEVWGLALSADHSLIVSGGVDSSVAVWRVKADETEAEREVAAEGESAAKRQRSEETSSRNGDRKPLSASDEDEDNWLSLMGTLPRMSTKRVVSVTLSLDGRLLAVQSADRLLETWTLRSKQQIDKRRKSRRKKQQREEKEASKRKGEKEEEKEEQREGERFGSGTDDSEVHADDLFSALPALRTDVKVVSVALAAATRKRSVAVAGTSASHRMLLSLADNSLAYYNVNLAAADTSASASASDLYSLVCSVEQAGHRSPVRTLALSSDHSLLLSGSSDQLKLHSLHSQQCIRTLQCSSAALCCLFVPGNKHIVVGCKDGSITWYELGSARCLGNVSAHDGSSVYSMHLRPDGRGFTSGGGDKCVRQWEFELVADENSSTAGRVLSIVLSRTLTLTDDVLCVRHSPNGKYVAVGLLDSTIKVFHSDTLLFFLSLYGHRLPVLSIDFSSDSQLLASASADKNVKVWGVAFGDCQCSLFAHADTVTQVRFIPRTHYVVSAGKDGVVKVWDADARQCIQELTGHTSEVWALEVAAAPASAQPPSDQSPALDLIVAAGNDRSLRVWRQSDEMLFIDEERENKRDALLDSKDASKQTGRVGEAEGAGQRVEVEGEMVSTALTADMMKGAEGLMEAIDMAHAEKERVAAFHAQQQKQHSGGEEGAGATSLDRALMQLSSNKSPPAELDPNPFLRGLSPSGYVMSALSALPASAVDDCLLQLPFSYALRLLDSVGEVLAAGDPNVELAVSSLLTLLQVHDRVIISNRLLVADMQRLRRLVRERLRSIKESYGRNKAALQLLQQRVDEQRGMYQFA